MSGNIIVKISSMHCLFFNLLFLNFILFATTSNVSFIFNPTSLTVELNNANHVSVIARLSDNASSCITGTLVYTNQRSDTAYFDFSRENLEFCFTNSVVATTDFEINGLQAVNHAVITINVTSLGSNQQSVISNNSNPVVHSDGALIVNAAHHIWLIKFSAVIGWCYVISWAVVAYPQYYTCIRNKSVVGLDFNFAILGWLSFLCYAIFNASLFWNETVKSEYFKQHPFGVNPVQPNDVFLGFNSLCTYSGYLVMIVVLERGSQGVSWVCYLICGALSLFIFVSLVLAAANVINWLLFVQNLAYVKLFATTIKYIPQVWLNYRKKSTAGWNMLFPILDFTGGVLSLLQMFLISYNFDDWTEISGDLAKFGLGLVALVFDTIFLFQRFYLYPPGKDENNVREDVRKISIALVRSEADRKFSIQKKLP